MISFKKRYSASINFQRVANQIYFITYNSYIFMTESQILTGPFNITCQVLSLLFSILAHGK